ncbi:tetratricopeptide repeat protein [Portibacter lacus]|uniref:Tetratricopeptide repeat protein n=1 Tax=Portibacter lacus TaxID=1099794 RepID=A0AA37SR53_9BACT|nr:hypothetical protein [Portibacter lacus]GLR18244.1 hypothetical protein GCM10007940_28600 [Portibacter lacus]
MINDNLANVNPDKNKAKLKNTKILIIFALTILGCKTQNADQLFEKAIQYEDHDRYKKAIAMLNKAIELNPKFEKAYLNRAIDKSIIGDYRTAINDLDKMINLNENAIEPYVWRAEYKRNLERYEDAMKDVEKALQLKEPQYNGTDIVGSKEFYINKLYPEGENYNIELEFIVFERAAANYHLGNYEQALRDLEFCEQPETEPINTHYYKGLTLLELKRIKEACEELQKSYKSGEKYALVVYNEYCK